MNVVTVLTDRALRSALGYLLREEKHHGVHHVHGLDEVLPAVLEHEAEVLLVGDGIPSGPLAVIDLVTADPGASSTAVVVVGDNLSTDETELTIERGAADVLRNPYDGADVIARVMSALRTKSLLDEMRERNEELEELVSYDELTGLRNRRAVMLELEQLLAGAARHGHLLSACMLDIDHFKRINDTTGHRAGDQVLRGIATRIEARLRRSDVAGRLGGDELLILLPDTDAAGANKLAEGICADIAAVPLDTSAGPLPVTVSAGIAEWADEEDAATLLERADGALYAAKAAGRGRAVKA